MMICAEPDNLTVGEFVTVGSVAQTQNALEAIHIIHVYVNENKITAAFFTTAIKNKRTQLYSLKTPQHWKPVLASWSCQRSELLPDESSLSKSLTAHFCIYLYFLSGPTGVRHLLQHRQRGVWSHACGSKALATKITLLHQRWAQRAAPVTDAVMKPERRQEQRVKRRF